MVSATFPPGMLPTGSKEKEEEANILLSPSGPAACDLLSQAAELKILQAVRQGLALKEPV